VISTADIDLLRQLVRSFQGRKIPGVAVDYVTASSKRK